MTFLKHSKLFLVILVCFLAFGCDSSSVSDSASSSSRPSRTEPKKAPPIPALQPGDEIAVIETEGFGKVKIQLFPDVAPKHVENFKKLINEGFYNGLAIFNRGSVFNPPNNRFNRFANCRVRIFFHQLLAIDHIFIIVLFY